MAQDRQEVPITLIRAGNQHVGIAPGALKYLVRHSFRTGVFEFKEPYADEAHDFGGDLSDLIDLAVSLGWFVRASASEVVGKWAKVDDLKDALASKGMSAKGRRPELLDICLVQCTDWVERFSALRPGYRATDQGVIELQATRPSIEPHTKESHIRQMRGYFDRDLKTSRKSAFILGFKVWARNDWNPLNPCPLASTFEGVYLPDEVPELYPYHCPDESACACILYEFVFKDDQTFEAKTLSDRMAARGIAERISEVHPSTLVMESRSPMSWWKRLLKSLGL